MNKPFSIHYRAFCEDCGTGILDDTEALCHRCESYLEREDRFGHRNYIDAVIGQKIAQESRFGRQ